MKSLLGLLVALTITSAHKHSSHPLVLLISFDGFRWDYLKTHTLPNFEYLKGAGSHAEYINNAFSTVTFPNHWTLVTGLYEETHGIVQNFMYDPVLKETFDFTKDEDQTLKWFGQNKITEPIWTTNQKAADGRRSAAEWVGSNVIFADQHIVHIPYNKSRPYKELVDQFIQLYTSESDPINFGALYFDEPDHTGHIYGPYSPQMSEKLTYIDGILGYLIEQLKSHHLFDKLNLIVTSDHGMESISEANTVFLDKFVDTNLFDTFGTRAVHTLFIKNPADINTVYYKLKSIPNIDVYKKDELPEELHYKNNGRIGDIVLVAKLGHSMYVNTQAIDWKVNNGDHGYYNKEKNMLPIFIAHGPAFKANYQIKPFNNVDIYPLMCLLLGVPPAVNNGSLMNVLDMVNYNEIEQSATMFLALLLIPIAIVGTTALLACFSCRKAAPNRGGYTNHTNSTLSEYSGYKSVAQSETAVLIHDNENDDFDDDNNNDAQNDKQNKTRRLAK